MSKRTPINPRITSEILELSDYKCFYCRADFSNLNQPTIDHIRPLSKGGSNLKSNLIACCEKCNNSKGDMPIEEFFKKRGGKKEFEKAVRLYLNLTEFEIKVLRFLRKFRV